MRNTAVDMEWEKLETFRAWQMTKVKSKREVILEAQREQRTVHFASLMDIGHLKNAELEPKYQKYKGRVVLRVTVYKTMQAPTLYSQNKVRLHLK